MNGHAMKFVFLVAVIGAVLFSRAAYPAASTGGFSEAGGLRANAESQIPLFIMPSVSAVSPAEEAATATVPDILSASFAQGAPPPQFSGAASLTADLAKGVIFEAANAGKRWPIASLTKLMTAAVASDKLDAAARITITQEMFAADPLEATLAVGGTYSAADLLRVMLLPSSNVAAQALASFYGEGNFLAEMNARAAAWGMNDTHFGDPSGLSAANQSTANDLLKLAQKIYANYPEIFRITRTAQASVTEAGSGKKMLIKSINNFAGNADFIGGKTGYTAEADGNLLSVFQYRKGRPVLILVLGTDDRFSDTQKLYDWFKTNFK